MWKFFNSMGFLLLASVAHAEELAQPFTESDFDESLIRMSVGERYYNPADGILLSLFVVFVFGSVLYRVVSMLLRRPVSTAGFLNILALSPLTLLIPSFTRPIQRDWLFEGIVLVTFSAIIFIATRLGWAIVRAVPVRHTKA